MARLPADEHAKCDQRRWQPQSQEASNNGIGPLAHLDARKRVELDRVAANQAACLDYKKRPDEGSLPWLLRDTFRNGLC